MKKFSFPLNTVLDYKNQVLDTLMNEHGKILKSVIDQELQIESLIRQYGEQNADFKQKKLSGISISEAQNYEQYFRQLEAKINQEKNKLEVLKQKAEQKRIQVVEAKTETASIEKLKENKLTEYNKEVRKNDELLIEEFVSHLRVAHSS